ncbi:DEAD/DEAH box helicase [SAR202 cluster bacterium AD-493-K16_JPT_193m]|nr:DEAD/DEAH box helicase [SAR202 cluster bacterium AD-493-K16_JPT_193m]
MASLLKKRKPDNKERNSANNSGKDVSSIQDVRSFPSDGFIEANGSVVEHRETKSEHINKNEAKLGSRSFGNIPVTDSIAQALKRLRYVTPTDIQSAVIPVARGGADVVGQAQTGTGKTSAFGIPLVEFVQPETRKPQALVLVPTRELAVQVTKEIGLLGRFKGVKVLAIYGGQSIQKQISLANKGLHVIVATPGRLLDHLQRGTLRINGVKFLVLDEADQMLDIGFADAIRAILRYVPRERQTLLFSATMPQSIRRLAKTYLNRPEWVLIGGEAEPVQQVRQLYFEVAERDRYKAMEELLQEPSSVKQALVFRRTKIGVDHLVDFLRRRGHNVQSIHSDLSQSQRDSVMRQFRSNKLRILVATNIVARGLDIPAVSHVINYDIPDNLEEYIHRIGRTARMGRTGTAITFVSEWDFEMLDAIKSHVGDQIKAEHLGLYGAARSS